MENDNNLTTVEVTKVPKLKKSFTLAWSTQGIGLSASYIILGYLTIYATNVMGLDAGAVGIAFMLSKIFDGISDVIAGVLIDKTNTKLGKGRPYALAIIGYWVCIGLIFSAPQMSRFAGIIYLFVLYTLIYSVFYTLLQCSEPVYMANALDDPRQSMTLLSFGGVLSTIVSLIFGVVTPQLISAVGWDNPAGWSKIAWGMTVPLTLVGLIRFLVIKEKRNVATVQTQKVTVKEMVTTLFNNKYILILAVLVFISYLGSNLSGQVGSYYTTYIYGDIGMASIMTLSMIPLVVLMAFLPLLARKFTLRKCIIALMIMGIVGTLIRLIDIHSILLGFIGSCISGMAFPAFYGFAATMTLDCMDYGEWKNGTRVEGALSSIQSLMNKIGTAVAVGLAGVLMSASGFDSIAAQQNLPQPDSALTMIVALSTVIPALFYVLFLVIFKFYDLEAKIPAIRQQLAERHEKAK